MVQKREKFAERIFENAFSLAEERGWERVSLGDIAHKAGVQLADLYEHYPTKRAILTDFTKHMDRRVLARTASLSLEEVGSAKDRLFDVFMTRFEEMQPYRTGLGAVLWDQLRKPWRIPLGLPRLSLSVEWMLEAAHIPIHDTLGGLRVCAATGAYIAAVRVWLRDDTPDLAHTMAALDKQLDRLGRMEQLCSGMGGYAHSTRRPGAQPGVNPGDNMEPKETP